MKEVINVLWAVPCCYHGSETLLEVCDFFKNEVIDIEISGVHDGAEAAKEIYEQSFNLVVLDHNLKYLEIVERFIQGIAIRNFHIIVISEKGDFYLERGTTFLEEDLGGFFQNIKEILEKIFKRR
jgi:hypothetical protein